MSSEEHKAKVILLQKASNDPLFIADMLEVSKDFEGIESDIEEWEQQDLPDGFLHLPIKPPSHHDTK